MTRLRAEGVAVSGPAGEALLRPLSLAVGSGERLVILGETGSGKSLLAQALMGMLPAGLAAAGTVVIDGAAFDAARPAAFRPLWGRRVALLPQEPWLALDPLMRAGAQVEEAHRLVRRAGGEAARDAAARDLAALGLAGAARRYPHELSGGMAQRVAFAAATAGGADIVIADEPTKGLDVARRDDVADLLLRGPEAGGALVVITHDLALARRIGGRALLIRAGEVVEAGETAALLSAPRSAYARAFVAADPEAWPAPRPRGAGAPLLRAEGVSVARGGRALVEGFGVEIAAGEIVGLTGPSGCGKSSLGDTLLGLAAPAAGRVERLGGHPRTAFQKLWQDPVAAFPHSAPLGSILRETARRHGAPEARIGEGLERMRLPAALLARRAQEVSGGELQRLALLRVSLASPRLLFADEPTSRLDPVTQAEVIGQIRDLAENGCAVLLVSHDPALIRKTAGRSLSLAPP